MLHLDGHISPQAAARCPCDPVRGPRAARGERGGRGRRPPGARRRSVERGVALGGVGQWAWVEGRGVRRLVAQQMGGEISQVTSAFADPTPSHKRYIQSAPPPSLFRPPPPRGRPTPRPAVQLPLPTPPPPSRPPGHRSAPGRSAPDTAPLESGTHRSGRTVLNQCVGGRKTRTC